MTNDQHFTSEVSDIIKLLNSQKPKMLILYLVPEHQQPNPELMPLLKKMAGKDYLCFICLHSSQNGSDGIKKLEPDLFLVHQGLSVIPIFKNLSAVILSTQAIHPEWAELLPHKFLWFHSNSTLNLSPDISADLHSHMYAIDICQQADLVSYSENDQKAVAQFSADPRSLALNLSEENQSNWVLIEEGLKSNPKGWQVYANLDLQGKIAVMTATFFDFEGEFFFSGGAERYLMDLAEICQELGREMVVFQYGNYPWMRHFQNLDVISLSRSGQKAEGWILKCAKAFNRIFYEQVLERTALNIYSAFFEAWPQAATPNIGISHGVAWDNSYCAFENAYEFWAMNERHIQGAKACQEMVSVDTNSANWFQTVDFNLGQRTKVIPNYVDLSLFKPRKDYLEKRDNTVVLYPRQLYMGRGLYLVLEIMEDILAKYPDVEFHFVGRGAQQDVALVLDKQKTWGARVKCYAQPMEEMHKVYQDADIALIPSVHSEGTSLSCLEAMASGNAIIASRVGGLSDLIINNYNGFLVDPHPEDLKQALIKLLEDPEQLRLFKKRSPEVAQAFSKTSWRNRWKRLIQNKLETSSSRCLPSAQPKNRRSVEIRLKDDSIDFVKLGELVTTLLREGCLVYIRSKQEPDPALSFARVQWIGPDTELFSPCNQTIEW